MNALFANDLYKNPEGWAGKAVGAPWRYRFSQAMTIFGGCAIFVLFVALSGGRHAMMGYIVIAFVIGAFAIACPLMYLRALKDLYLKMQSFKRTQAGVPDRL